MTRVYSVVGANTRDDFAYGLDKDDNRLYRENNVTSAKDEYYMYDTLNRLTSMDRGDLNANKDAIASSATYQDWNLDKVGNWDLFWDDSATALTRTHNDANEITAVDGSGTNLGHDEAGNLTRMPLAATYQSGLYDHFNRLTCVKDDNGDAVEEYAYDALGRRIEVVDKTGESDVTYTLYYGHRWRLLEEYKDGDSDVYKQYVWGGQYIDEAIRYERDSDTDGSMDDTLFYSQDGNWNVTALLNADGTAQARYLYTAYGDPIVLEGDWTSDSPDDKGNAVRYCGYLWDDLAGLYHVRYRAYAPTLGRWLQRDPIGYIDGMSLYQYVGSKPLAKYDAYGLLSPRENCYITCNESYPSWWQGLQFLACSLECDSLTDEEGPGIIEQTMGVPLSIGCVLAIKNAIAGRVAAGAKGEMPHGFTNDKQLHCYYSCDLTKACGENLADALGIMKEATDEIRARIDWLIEHGMEPPPGNLGDPLPGGADPGDFQANMEGIEAGKSGKDCVCACKNQK